MSYNQKLSIRLIFKKEWVFGETWHPKQRLIFLLRGKYCNNKKKNPKSAVNKGFWHETYRNKDTEGKRWRSQHWPALFLQDGSSGSSWNEPSPIPLPRLWTATPSASWPPQSTLSPLSGQTTQHDSAEPISLIQPHPCVDTILSNAAPRAAHTASWCKTQPAHWMVASIKATLKTNLRESAEIELAAPWLNFRNNVLSFKALFK